VKKMGLSTLDPSGQKVLMRVDFNVPLDKDRNITDDTRILAALPSIKHILEGGGSLVLMSHLGRPQGKVDLAYSLRPVADRLSELLSSPVKFATDTVGADAGAKVFEYYAGAIGHLCGQTIPVARGGFNFTLRQPMGAIADGPGGVGRGADDDVDAAAVRCVEAAVDEAADPPAEL